MWSLCLGRTGWTEGSLGRLQEEELSRDDSHQRTSFDMDQSPEVTAGWRWRTS